MRDLSAEEERAFHEALAAVERHALEMWRRRPGEAGAYFKSRAEAFGMLELALRALGGQLEGEGLKAAEQLAAQAMRVAMLAGLFVMEAGRLLAANQQKENTLQALAALATGGPAGEQ